MEVKDWLGENNTLGIDIWNKKYRYNNESFDEWLDRVSGNDKHIKQLIIDKKFLFAGRILAGRGIADKEECKQTLSNCYVLPPVEDNLESIFDTAKHLARTSSYGGGVGVDISKLAPTGAIVRNSAKTSTGAVSFMDLYSLTTGLIGQTHRQGALIITMDVSHPDIEKFITIKSDVNKVNKANISVKITDEFMNAVKNNTNYELYYKRKETGEEFVKQVNARELFALICYQAWDNAEPGVLFWDRIRDYNLMSADDNYEPAGVNPCGEQVLPAGGACLLGSINLAAFVTEDKKFDFEKFRMVVFEAIRALNIVLDEGQPLHPLEIQRDSAYEWRPMGLGIMGLGDMLIKMEIVYGSQESLDLCDEIGHVMAQCAIIQSIEDAETHGSFPNCDKYSIIDSEFFNAHAHQSSRGKVLYSGIRNCQLLCIAPTGCQKPETLVGTDAGLFRLDEMVDPAGSKWQSMSGVTAIQDFGSHSITKGYVNGFKCTKKITLSNNVQLEATPNHQYRVIRNGKYKWCRADKLKVGDVIPCKLGYYKKETEFPLIHVNRPCQNVRPIYLPETLDPDLAFIIGAYFSNGSTHKKGIRFTMNVKKVDDIEYLSTMIRRVFTVDPTYFSTSGGAVIEVCINNQTLLKWLDVNGLKKKKSNNNQIPLPIRCSSVDSIKEYIRGYYMCDGGHSGSSYYIDTSSYENAQQFVVLCRAIGVDSRISIGTIRSGALSSNPMYRIYIGGYKSLFYPVDKMQYVSRTKRETLQEVRDLLGDDFAFDTVTKIEDSASLTLDLEVDSEHHYIANGVISHNTISTMLNVSGGIEPIFDRYYERKTETLNDEEKIYKVYTQIVWDYMQKHGISEEDNDQLPEWFITSKEIPYPDRIKMQAVWQKHIDVSISSTVNLPESTTIEDVMDLYMMAWEEGLKGVTIFREGCKRAPILKSLKKKEKPLIENSDGSLLDDEETYSLSWKNDVSLSDRIKYLEDKLAFADYKDDDEKHAIIRTIEYYKFADRRLVHPEDDKIDIKKHEFTDEILTSPTSEARVLPMTKSHDGVEPLSPISKEGNTLERGEVIKTPPNSIGKKKDLMTGCGSLHFQAFFDMETGDVVETYLSKGSKGGCNSFMIGLSRMISLAGRAGVDIYTIVDQLHSVPSCTSYASRRATKHDTSKGTCCPGAIGYALIEMYEEVKEEIELGGVYYGSPLYYKLKAERDANERHKEKEHPIIPEQTSKLADTLLAIPGVSDVLSGLTDGELSKALDDISKASFDQNIRTMDCDICEKGCNVHQMHPVSKEEFDLAVKDLAAKVDSDIRKSFDDTNKVEKNARIIESLKKHPGMIQQLADQLRSGELTSIEDLLASAEHGIQPVGLRSNSPIFVDVKEDMQNKYVEDTGLCPECGNPLSFEGGCNTCKACGWSRCD